MLKCTVVRQNPVTTRPSALQRVREREKEKKTREEKEEIRLTSKHPTAVSGVSCDFKGRGGTSVFPWGQWHRQKNLSLHSQSERGLTGDPATGCVWSFQSHQYTSTTSTTRIANVGTGEVGTGECQIQPGDLRSKNGLIWPCCLMCLPVTHKLFMKNVYEWD